MSRTARMVRADEIREGDEVSWTNKAADAAKVKEVTRHDDGVTIDSRAGARFFRLDEMVIRLDPKPTKDKPRRWHGGS